MPRRLIDELKTLSVWTLPLALTGCIGTAGIAPRSEALSADALATDAAIQTAAQDAQWPQSQWWQAYGDRQLDTWVSLALLGSPSMAIAAARVRQAEALAGMAESAESLHIDATAALNRHDWPADSFYGPGDLSGQTTWDNHAGLGFTYALDLWGRERSASERAVDMAHMSAAQARQAQLELVNNVVQVYIQLSLHYAKRDIVQRTLAQQGQILELAQRRLRGGIGTHLEVSQAKALLPETHRQIDALDEQIALAQNQLAALAGKGPGQGSQLERPRLSLQAPLGLPSTLPAQLLGQRPDVVASRWAVAANARGIEVAHAGFYPNVDLVGSLSYLATGGGLIEFLAGRKLAYNAGPALSLPMFDGGRLRAHLSDASAGYDLAVARYNQTLVEALKQISAQLIRRASMDKQQAFAEQSVASARKSYDIALIAYQRGLTGYLEVLNAQTLLLRQQQIEQQVQAARLAVHAQLVTALGGGLGAGADAPAAERLQVPKPLAVIDR